VITFVLAALIAGVAALLRGGSLRTLAETQFGWLWLLFAGLAVQLTAQIWSPDWLGGAGGTAVILVSNLLVGAFLALNVRIPGVALILVGLALNVVVIAANGAMPVSAAAARNAGVEPPGRGVGDVEHELLTDDTVVPWLGDVLSFPGLPGVFSVGDVVLALGLGHLIYRRATWNRRPRRAAREPAASD
jgi:hypothetical protein